ncbi:MAG: hypothetical protein J7L50_01920 [Candidatus Odinarchaeota archaeon]|nr:hypothetical protein [Candidatus Odinarchaeota archaeon]
MEDPNLVEKIRMLIKTLEEFSDTIRESIVYLGRMRDQTQLLVDKLVILSKEFERLRKIPKEVEEVPKEEAPKEVPLEEMEVHEMHLPTEEVKEVSAKGVKEVVEEVKVAEKVEMAPKIEGEKPIEGEKAEHELAEEARKKVKTEEFEKELPEIKLPQEMKARIREESLEREAMEHREVLEESKILERPSVPSERKPEYAVRVDPLFYVVSSILDPIVEAAKSGISSKEIASKLLDARDRIMQNIPHSPVYYEMRNMSSKIAEYGDERVPSDLYMELIGKINEWKDRLVRHRVR